MGAILPSVNNIAGNVNLLTGDVRAKVIGKGYSLTYTAGEQMALVSAGNDTIVGSIAGSGNMLFYGGSGMAVQFYTSFAKTGEFKGGAAATAGLYLRGETTAISSHQQVAKAWASVNPAAGTFTGYGVSSLTDVGVGNTRVNFSTAFADENYSAVVTDTSNALSSMIKTTAYVQVVTGASDVPFNVAVFR